MIIKNVDALKALDVMRGLSETGKLGFAIAKNRRRIEDELKEYAEKVDEIIHEYGEVHDDGQFLIPSENVQTYLSKRAEYDAIECDIPVCTVDEDTFCSGNLTSDQMFALDWMCK